MANTGTPASLFPGAAQRYVATEQQELNMRRLLKHAALAMKKTGCEMQINEQVKSILSMLMQYSTRHLSDAEMLACFLQHAYDTQRQEQLGELSFRGKYLWKLNDTLGKHVPGSDLHAKLQEEFAEAAREFHILVEAFLADADSDFGETVRQRYLAVSHESFLRLLELAGDMNILKNWELDMTRDQGSE